MKRQLSDVTILRVLSTVSILIFLFNFFSFIDLSREIGAISTDCEELLNQFKGFADEAAVSLDQLKRSAAVEAVTEKIPRRRRRQSYDNPTGTDEEVQSSECGDPGPPGPPGSHGSPGENGHDGIPGEHGMTGLHLATMISSQECVMCPMGPPGIPGPDGPVGPPGSQGPPGSVGLARSGLAGSVGPPGDSGPPGSSGPPGAPGSPGQMGIRPIGLPGLAGPPGPPGGTGLIGAPGVSPTGAMGPPGPSGIPGNPGVAGPFGSPGQVGPPGTPGSDAQYCPCGPRTIQDISGGGAQSFEGDNSAAIGPLSRTEVPTQHVIVPIVVVNSATPPKNSPPQNPNLQKRQKNFLWEGQSAKIQPSGYRITGHGRQ